MRVIGLAGWSGAGKTTLLKRLIPELTGRGLSVSTLKHAHHAFDVDQPGKDSHEHRLAGATEVLIASRRRFALMHELRDAEEPRLEALLRKLSPVDLVLVEGFKREAHRKIEIYREANAKPPIHPEDPDVVALAADRAFPDCGLTVVDLNDIVAVAQLVVDHAEPLVGLLPRLAGSTPRPRRRNQH